MEGQHLHITPPSTLAAAVQHELNASGSASSGIVQAFDKPLVLYCILEGVLQAEKLRPMFSSPDVSPRYLKHPPLPPGALSLHMSHHLPSAIDVCATHC